MPYPRFLAFASLIALATSQQAPICEDTIDSQPPFNNNNIPCLLGCGTPLAMATGSLLPGSVNVTDIPYCRLNCVRRQGVTPAQSSRAPACNSQCENGNGATPDQLGWCMYWCVEGGEIASSVLSTTCVPSLEYTPVLTTETFAGRTSTFTYQQFTMPTQWASWYQTQTVIPRTSPLAFAPSTHTVSSVSTMTSDGGYYDSSGVYHLSSTPAGSGGCDYYSYGSCAADSAVVTSTATSTATGSTAVVTAVVTSTASRRNSSSMTTETAEGDAQAQSAEPQSASTTTAGSGSTETYRLHWILQAFCTWLVAFV